jgi:hypothetical protein
LICVAFAFGFVSIFLPETFRVWLFPSFIAVQMGVTVLYLVAARRSRVDAARIRRELHHINDKTDR